MACDDKNDESSPLVGTWELSNLGEYANSDCTGDIDYTAWGFIQAFGMMVTIVINEDGTGTFTLTFGSEKEEAALTWDDRKSQLCITGDCITYKLDGDSFTIDQPEEAYCEDDNFEETSHGTQTECETAGNTWNEASCSVMTFTKK